MRRTCCDCKTDKELDLFPTDRQKPLGRGYRCVECTRARAKKRALDMDTEMPRKLRSYWREEIRKDEVARKEEAAAHNAEVRYYEAMRKKEWSDANREKVREYQREYQRKYYAENKEELKAQKRRANRKYYMANRERILAQRKAEFEAAQVAKLLA